MPQGRPEQTTWQPASPFVNLDRPRPVGDAEEGDLGRAFAVKRAVPAARGQPAPRVMLSSFAGGWQHGVGESHTSPGLAPRSSWSPGFEFPACVSSEFRRTSRSAGVSRRAPVTLLSR